MGKVGKEGIEKDQFKKSMFMTHLLLRLDVVTEYGYVSDLLL